MMDSAPPTKKRKIGNSTMEETVSLIENCSPNASRGESDALTHKPEKTTGFSRFHINQESLVTLKAGLYSFELPKDACVENSDFLRKAFTVPMQEQSTSCMAVEDMDPWILGRVVQFMLQGRYETVAMVPDGGSFGLPTVSHSLDTICDEHCGLYDIMSRAYFGDNHQFSEDHMRDRSQPYSSLSVRLFTVADQWLMPWLLEHIFEFWESVRCGNSSPYIFISMIEDLDEILWERYPKLGDAAKHLAWYGRGTAINFATAPVRRDTINSLIPDFHSSLLRRHYKENKALALHNQDIRKAISRLQVDNEQLRLQMDDLTAEHSELPTKATT